MAYNSSQQKIQVVPDLPGRLGRSIHNDGSGASRVLQVQGQGPSTSFMLAIAGLCNLPIITAARWTARYGKKWTMIEATPIFRLIAAFQA